MTSGGRQVDVVVGGGQLPMQRTGSSVRVLYHSFGLQTSAWSKLLVLTGKKLAFKFSTLLIILSITPPPPHHQPRIYLTLFPWWMLPGLPRFSLLFCSRVLLWTQTIGRNGEGLGTRLWLTDFSNNWQTDGWTQLTVCSRNKQARTWGDRLTSSCWVFPSFRE